eukprot:TRINITY_DN6481_c0_g1_i4.p1 TRINITY_DN6481_c0_g1~~TRINITY_DN6481_c0_g1_i4.p1  ORF type:complete len:374 (+),score=75.67 TRINITY_DN6481_c0_g1_i4:219-1340(+)
MLSVMNCLWGCISRFVVHHTDTAEDISRKQRSVLVSVTGLVVPPCAYATRPTSSVYEISAVAMCIIAFSSLLAHLVWTRTAPSVSLEIQAYVATAGLLTMLYSDTRRGHPPQVVWVVIFLDMCLVNRLPSRVTTSVIVGTCIAVSVMSLLMILDLPLPDTAEYRHFCDCDDPPCRVDSPTVVSSTLQDMMVLLLDFSLTRGFAHQMVAEKETTQSSIDTAQQVAECLSGFDLEAAEQLLREDSRPPPGLTEALRIILNNLRLYKPYLPKSCLPIDVVAVGVEYGGKGTSTVSSNSSRASLISPTQTLPSSILKRCTLVVTNLHGSLQLIEDAALAFELSLSRVLEVTLLHAQASRGMVDMFMGDKIFLCSLMQ